MNVARPAALPALALAALASCAPRPSARPAPQTVDPLAPAVTAAPPYAQAGDTVYLVEFYVRPERRQHFEDFVRQVLWPTLAARTTDDGDLLSQTRMLVPLRADADSAYYTYAFLLDPVVPGESYDILELLRVRFGNDQALEQYDRFTGTWARDFTARSFVQSPKPEGR